jgi:hypothetical protein
MTRKAAVKMGPFSTESGRSCLPGYVCVAPIVLQKSFYTGDQKFYGLRTRLSCKDVRGQLLSR